MVEWWHNLVFYLASVLLGGLLGYFLTRLGAKQERKSRTEEQLQNAGRSILAELKTNLKLAEQPFQGRFVPFVTDAWNVHRGEVPRLPEYIQDTLYKVYVQIQITNALVQSELYQYATSEQAVETYQRECNKITEKAEEARELLANWLTREGIEEVKSYRKYR